VLERLPSDEAAPAELLVVELQQLEAVFLGQLADGPHRVIGRPLDPGAGLDIPQLGRE
jgi:hypothetical protein